MTDFNFRHVRAKCVDVTSKQPLQVTLSKKAMIFHWFPSILAQKPLQTDWYTYSNILNRPKKEFNSTRSRNLAWSQTSSCSPPTHALRYKFHANNGAGSLIVMLMFSSPLPPNMTLSFSDKSTEVETKDLHFNVHLSVLETKLINKQRGYNSDIISQWPRNFLKLNKSLF